MSAYLIIRLHVTMHLRSSWGPNHAQQDYTSLNRVWSVILALYFDIICLNGHTLGTRCGRATDIQEYRITRWFRHITDPLSTFAVTNPCLITFRHGSCLSSSWLIRPTMMALWRRRRGQREVADAAGFAEAVKWLGQEMAPRTYCSDRCTSNRRVLINVWFWQTRHTNPGWSTVRILQLVSCAKRGVSFYPIIFTLNACSRTNKCAHNICRCRFGPVAIPNNMMMHDESGKYKRNRCHGDKKRKKPTLGDSTAGDNIDAVTKII